MPRRRGDARSLPIPKGNGHVDAAGFASLRHLPSGPYRPRRLKAGETLLVARRRRGVGLTAVEIGKKLGATVIATAGTPAKLAVAGDHGADHLIDHAAEDVRTRVLELTDGRGADVIYDPVGGAAFAASLRSVAWGGRILVIGFASGTIPQVPANILLVKHIGVLGFSWGTYRQHRPDLLTGSMDTLLGWTPRAR
jgi:NADPH2:quinone reductase